MNRPHRLAVSVVMLLGLAGPATAQDPPVAPDEPVLRLEVGGPTTPVMGLAFSPDGETLYEAGWDKIVRVWTRNPDLDRFEPDEEATYRIPIGPGSEGAINALAVSQDGRWLAVGGNSVVRGGAGFRRSGLMIPDAALTEEMLRDRGTIFVFDTRSQPRSVRQLRGHLGAVLSLNFAERPGDLGPMLVSTARERGEDGDVGAVRLWEVESGRQIGFVGNLPDPKSLPGLASWPAGDGSGAIRAGLAWGDGTLRVIDSERADGPPRSFLDGPLNSTMAWIAGRNRLASGSFDDRQAVGQLRLWDVTDGRPPALASRLLFLPAAGERAAYYPRAIAPIPPRAGEASDLAAVVLLRDPGQNPAAGDRMEYRLRVVGLDPGPGEAAVPRIEVRLWSFSPIPPSLAVSPDGRFLAVAGNAGRAILVYEVADLIRGVRDSQMLRGVGEPLRDVAFLARGDEPGLLLRPKAPDVFGAPPRPIAPDDLVFDIDRRQPTTEQDGWELDAPVPAGWSVRVLERAAGQEARLALRGPDGREQILTLRPRHEPTAVAVLPPRPPLETPLVAVATEREGEPLLSLYDGSTGLRFRQLTGHSQRVTGLAFSSDGRLLASAGEDQTVSLWSLTDLADTLGRRGELTGLAVTEREGLLVVAEVEEGAAPGLVEAVREGDVVLGLVNDEGDLDAIDSLFTFYRQVSRSTPGSELVVRIAREGEGGRDVRLPLGQLVDERKPLLSLFVTRPDEAGERAWIGWNPLGPYDSSGPSVERLLGWHFNTGEPGSPTRFAESDQFLEFRREGLLAGLVVQASLPPPPEPPPIEPPELSLGFDIPAESEAGDRLLIREAPETLRLTMLDSPIRPDQIARIEWRMGDDFAGAMTPDGPRSWSVDLGGIAWDRAERRVRAIVHTNEAAPQTFEISRAVRFRPPAPEVLFSGEMPREVDRPEFAVRATVQPLGGPARVRLEHSAGERREVERWEAAGPIEIEHNILLEPGVNILELVAENEGAPEGFAGPETASAGPLVVVFSERPEPSPTIRIEGVMLADDGRAFPISGGPIVVDGARVRIGLGLASEQPIERVEWSIGDEWVAVDLDGPDAPGGEITARIEAEVQPGPNVIRFRARSAESEFGEARVAIAYRPPVPELIDLAMSPGDPVLIGDPDGDPPIVRLDATLDGPRVVEPFAAEILVDGEPIDGLAEIDREAGTLSAELPLKPGENQIQVRLTNEWGGSWSSEPIGVTYRRPPRIVRVSHSEIGESPLVDLTVEVASPADLPPIRAAIRVESEGGQSSSRAVGAEAFRLRDDGLWEGSVGGIPVVSGENTIAALAWNDDGRCTVPAEVPGLRFERPAPTPPEVIFLRPDRDTTEGRLFVSVAFEVRSSDPPASVVLVRDRTDEDREVLINVDPAGAIVDERGEFVLRVEHEVRLNPGANLLRAEAVTSAGAIGAARVAVGFVPPPARVVIDRIEMKGPARQMFEPEVIGDNRVSFSNPLPGPQGWVVGRVVWTDEATRARHEANRARLWVNRFPQSYAELTDRPGHPREQSFRAELILGREENEVSLELPGVPIDAVDRPEFRLSCTTPETRQRLHLLIVGVGESDPDALRLRAFESLLAEPHPDAPENPSRFQTPAFREGFVYGPLYDDVRVLELIHQLDQVNRSIQPVLTLPERPIEVVLVYYQGSAWVDEDRSFLGLRRGNGRGRRESVTLDFLADRFAETRGVQLFFIDARRPLEPEAPPITQIVAQAPERWPPSEHLHHVGLLSFTWWHEQDETPRPVPAREATLIAALDDAIRRRSRLREVAETLLEGFEALGLRYPNITYDRHLPDALSDVIMGAPPGLP